MVASWENGRQLGFITERVRRAVLGGSDASAAGREKALRGLREHDRGELIIGLGLSAIAWLQSTRPRKKLIYRKKVPVGSAIVVHHKKTGSPRIEVVKPKKRG
jgi:hypothetical protein